jgi:hypothetical protein
LVVDGRADDGVGDYEADGYDMRPSLRTVASRATGDGKTRLRIGALSMVRSI